MAVRYKVVETGTVTDQEIDSVELDEITRIIEGAARKKPRADEGRDHA